VGSKKSGQKTIRPWGKRDLLMKKKGTHELQYCNDNSSGAKKSGRVSRGLFERKPGRISYDLKRGVKESFARLRKKNEVTHNLGVQGRRCCRKNLLKKIGKNRRGGENEK